MTTSKEYIKNLQNKTISKAMLTDCLYSVNKRAKNYRDKEKECRDFRHKWRYRDKYHNEEKFRATKESFYAKKEILLSIIDPICIHKEFKGYYKTRIYENDDPNLFDIMLRNDEFVHGGHFYSDGNEVRFGDYYDTDKPRYNYYLFYDMGDHSFHSPIDEDRINDYNLPIIEIDELETKGDNIIDLLSCQFVDKVIELIKSNDFKIA